MKTKANRTTLSSYDAFELLSEENKKTVIRQIEILIERQSESLSSDDSQE